MSLDHLPVWLQAGIWGWLGAGSLILGAATAYLAKLSWRITAGILISARAYDLIFQGF